MDHDPSKARFFAFLSLFTFSMLGIVLANNFLEMFIFWELVGVSSYLLIGFWFEKPSAGDAAKKAFITNRLGDFGFILGILMVWGILGSLNFTALGDAMKSNPLALGASATAAGLLVFCGAVGKSAQFPLHVWLADAMEGPTPVSALIHAATMVAAGVYMLCRIFFLLNADALHVIAYIGGFTALLAALIAVQQNDIKRILAYSTLSQLGYMVMSVGLSGETPAMFHLTTHAFFKALLFLGAGSVIHGLHEEQDIWKMGGLKKHMPVTFWTFIIGTLALSGVPPFAGFYSKDSILGQALEQKNYLLFGVAVFVAGLTTFYMFRLFFVAFLGEARTEKAKHAHESPAVMTLPLVILAVLAVVGGFIGITTIYNSQFAPDAEKLSIAQQLTEPLHNIVPMALGIGAVVVGLLAAFSLYGKAAEDPLPPKLGGLATAMKNRFYFDELYEATFIRFHDFLAAVADWADRWLLEGVCIGFLRGGADFSGRALRLVQTGNLQTYAFLFTLGTAVLLYLMLGK
jgi:NADH-quinone oxidoreductase subunit L